MAPAYLGGAVAATPVPSTNSYEIRAWWPTAKGGIRYGPKVMTLSSWAWGHSGGAVAASGSIWVYDDGTRPMRVVRLSSRSGRIENRVPVPRLGNDPLMAADRDGLWIAPGPDFSSYSSRAPLYRIAAGSNVAVVAHRGGTAYEWMVASGHTVYADALSAARQQVIWRFDGPAATSQFASPARLLPDPLGIGTGYAAVGNESAGIATVNFLGPRSFSGPGCLDRQQVVLINPDTGQQSIVASLPSGLKGPAYGCVGDWLSHGQAVLLNRTPWLLDGTSAGFGYSRLFKVALPAVA
ncbi:MAG: hypothetical protein M0Z42_13065 [Actinomycetota bacterium]|jgi:hypothetical protein|nr:hypothetical protein [Actinomycetota bacterium]